MKVYKLTPEQAASLEGREMENRAYYNVSVKDTEGNIIISKEQYFYAQIGEEIEYNPIILEENGEL